MFRTIDRPTGFFWLLAVILFTFPWPGRADVQMAIMGDSAATGAVSSPEITATFDNLGPRLWQAVIQDDGAKQTAPTMQRIYFSSKEIETWWLSPFLKFAARVAQQTDSPELSFGAFVGQGLGIKPKDILLVGQNSLMVRTIPAQFERIFQTRNQTLPPLILMSFNANDFCDPKSFDPQIIRQEFTAALNRAWNQSEPFLKAAPQGTTIAVLAPLDVANIVTNPEILRRKIALQGNGTVTCGQIRSDRLAAGLGSWVMRRTLNLMCPSVTRPTSRPEETVKTLREVQDVIHSIWSEKIRSLNKQYAGQRLRWQYIESVRRIAFDGEDIGNDCFHPSVNGHRKIASEILKSLELPK